MPLGLGSGGVRHEAHQVDQLLAARGLVHQVDEQLVAIAQHQHIGTRHHFVEVGDQQRGDVRDLRLDVFLVGPVDTRVFDVAVEDAQLVALADEHLGQLHQRAFAQIVGAGLERQAEQADLAGVVAGDEIEGLLHLVGVAAHQRTEHRVLDVQLAGAIGEGAYILGRQEPPKAKPGRM